MRSARRRTQFKPRESRPAEAKVPMKLLLDVHGMDCAEEVATLRAALEPVKGIEALDFDLLHGRLTATLGAAVEPEAVLAAIAATGLRATRASDGAAPEKADSFRRRRVVSTVASGSLLAAATVVDGATRGWEQAIAGHAGASLAVTIALLAAVAVGGWFVAGRAWAAARRRRADMNLLMTIAVVGAIGIGQLFEAATVTFLFALSLTLEAWSVARSRRTIDALFAIAPTTARVRDEDGNERMVDATALAVGDRFFVKAGERVPLDGRVDVGAAVLDQSAITGESMPVEKGVGHEVFAGSAVQDGTVEVIAVKPAAASMAAQIAKLVTEAQSRRSPTERWVERFARWYTPAVLAVAILVAVVPPLAGGEWRRWLYEALVLLVIGCPCALVLATPISVVSALSAAAKSGVLLKGADTLEIPARLAAVAMDKTGTLTEGRPEVLRVVALAPHDEREVLSIAAAIDAPSDHPLARAIVRHAGASGIRPRPVEDFQVVAGKGVSARLDGRPVWIGSHRHLEERGQETPQAHEMLESLSAGGRSVVVVGEDDHVCGFIALADRIRPSAAAAVAELKSLGIAHVIMLTGDNRPTAEAIAREAGVDEVSSELLPQQKIEAVERLVAEHGTVAMVGDGVNDAPALARASIGVAMGVAGSEVAVQTADVALLSQDLSRLGWLVRHSRRTVRVMRQNVAVSLGVKAVVVAMTLSGHGSLWSAIAADMGVSLLVVANALTLLGSRAKSTPTRIPPALGRSVTAAGEHRGAR
jgi:Cd2+/Zn2+-exporting ATPase